MTSFKTIIAQVQSWTKKTVIVAAADEDEVLAATAQAKQEGLADFFYVGDVQRIRQLAAHQHLDISGIEMLDVAPIEEAGRRALQLIKDRQGQVLMKGRISTGQILGMLLKDEDFKAQDPQRFLSHVAIFEWENQLKVFSDPGLNIAPDLEQKQKITLNAIKIAQKLAIRTPKIAFLSAIETVSPKMRSSVEAAELARMDWGDAIADGPLAFDGALFAEAARIKGISSPVAGQADILICPNIETANLLYKTLGWMVKVDIAGVIAGAPMPLILTSRADSEHIKFLSIATALYLAV
jgi:phosphate butyryltransferase